MNTVRRLDFAHQLRGIASVAVLLSHYFFTFFTGQAALSELMGVPPLDPVPELPPLVGYFAQFGIIYGQFGVGVFFIISGFVIPLALSRETPSTFLVRRFFRLFPVYCVGFLFTASCIAAIVLYYGEVFPYSIGHILAHAGILTRGLFQFPRIDGISWTLEVELAFYLVMAIAGKWIIRFDALGLSLVATAPAIAALAAFVLLNGTGHGISIGLQFWAAILLVVGVAYCAWFQGRMVLSKLVVVNLVSFALLATVWAVADRAVFGWQWLAGYAIAMIVFAVCMGARSAFRPNRLLDHLADISYPLYVVHALPGYALMQMVISAGGGVGLAIALACGFSYLVALSIHQLVERPAIAAGKRLSRRQAGALQQN